MKRNNRGFTFVEIIVALGLAAILLPALGSALSFSIRVASQGEKFTQATSIAQQGMENLYSQKSQNWSSIVDGVTTTVSLPFTRTITISDVKRNLSGDIDSGGTNDPNTKLINVIVTWPEEGGSQKVALNSYVTNH